MKIGDIDKNLKVETNLDIPEMKWFTPLDPPISLHGIYGYTTDDGFFRMPLVIANATNEGVSHLAKHTAGGRIRFRTDSPCFAAKVYVQCKEIMPHITAIGQCGFDLYLEDNHIHSYIRSCSPAFKEEPDGTFSYEFLYKTDGQMHTYCINMPLYCAVKAFYIGFDPQSQLLMPEDYTISKPVLYYGSSITQGGCASRPGNAYQAIITRRFDCDHVNLGFSGSARGESVMAEYLASLDPSIFVLDYDYNAPDTEHLKATHEPLFKMFRAAHPTTPVIMVSAPDFHPLPYLIERKEIVHTTFLNARNAGDENVYFIDGQTILDGDCRDSCTVDGCHPNDLGFFRMAKVIGDVMEPLIEKLK